jgi:hypothetical protein
VYVLNVSSVLNLCCKCFHLDVTKVDLDVVFTCMFQLFHTSVASVFIWMLYMFAMVLKCFHHAFSQVFQTLVSSVLSVLYVACI